ncbi:MAG: hypothetical protein KDA38_12240, partial [Planctomycetales bacterium]|nr:hypothetical protein [Planctomycetales bacterium]
MSTRIPHASVWLVGCWLAVTATHGRMAIAQTPIPIATSTRTDAVSFDRDIMPIFRKKCLACHSSSEAYGDLVLESPAAMLKGGDAGPAIVPKQGAASLLLKLASHQAEPFMPPPGNDVAAAPMTSAELGLLKLWIDQGATSDSGSAAISPRDWRPLPPGINPIYAVAISPDGQYAACGRANQIFIYHVPTGQLITRLNDPAVQLRGDDSRPGVAHLDIVQSLAFNPDGDMLASGGFRTVKLWRRPRDVRTLNLAAAQSVTAVATSPSGEIIATALADNSIKLWNAADGQPLATLVGHEGPIHEVRFSHDGQRLYSASEDRSVRVWQTLDGQLIGRIDTPAAIQALTVLTEAVPVEPAEQVATAEASTAETSVTQAPAQPAAESASPSDQSAEDADKAGPPVVITERLATG